MSAVALALLSNLFDAGEACDAGVRKRNAALTRSNLRDYRALNLLPTKEAIEVVLRQARDAGCVSLSWDDPGERGFIKRIELLNHDALAAFLGRTQTSVTLAQVSQRLEPHLAMFPVLQEVLERWRKLKKVRGTNPARMDDWLDAIRVIAAAENRDSSVDAPLRQMSARLFNDSKRIEKLSGPLDALLTGSLDSEARPPAEVWKELGLFREEQPVLLAGRVEIRRDRLTSVPDAPYGGFPPYAVKGLAGLVPASVLSIENLTTFHSVARRHSEDPALLIYSAGMPSPAWRAMYRRILSGLPVGVPVFHWGDVDEGGFRIASVIAADAMSCGVTLRPWRMHPDDVPPETRRTASAATLKRIAHFAAKAGWAELGDAVNTAGFTVEQESL